MKTAFILVATAAALVLLAGCGGGDDTAAPAPATTAETTTATEAATTIPIVVADGKVGGGIQRPKIEQNAHVVLVVTSDVADEVHIHGYDLHGDVGAGGTVRIPFVATIPGRFEVELESSRLQLAEITVTP